MAKLAKGFHDERYRELIGKLVAERKRLGLSQRELADKIGQHQQFVSRYELGERRLDIIEFIDVVVALALKPSHLVADIITTYGEG